MNSTPLTVLAVGAAGPFAGLVVPELAKRGAKVRGLIRHPEQEAAVRAAGATEVALGDLTDPASVAAALEGVERVFYIAPAFLPDQAKVGVAFVAAAKAAGVRRIVYSGVIHPIIAALDNHIAAAPVEEAILESGLEYALLHPTLFFQNFAEGWKDVLETGAYAEPWSADSLFSRVDYRDVAEVAAIALTEDRLNDGTYELCAEGSLNRHEVVALMGETLGRRIEAATVDPSKIPNRGEPMLRMFDWYDHRGLRGNALTLRAILGREPRTIRAYIEELTAKTPGAAVEPARMAA